MAARRPRTRRLPHERAVRGAWPARPRGRRRDHPHCVGTARSRIPPRARPRGRRCRRPRPWQAVSWRGFALFPRGRSYKRNLGHAKSDNMSNKMWGGRFHTSPDAVMEDINASIDFDRHLFRQDIAASKAHAAMLAKQGIITADDARAIAHGLDTILSEIESGKFKFKRALEDIHMNVESRLAELIGPAAGRLHTARSRNDQVATDF